MGNFDRCRPREDGDPVTTDAAEAHRRRILNARLRGHDTSCASSWANHGLLLVLALCILAAPAAARSVGDPDCRAKEYSLNVVLVVQEALRKSGHFVAPPDGLPHALTRAAIRKYRRERGLGDSDRIDPAFLRALLGDAYAVQERTELQDICEELGAGDGAAPRR